MAKFNHGDYKIETLCVQEGYEPENAEARVLPIVQSTTYQYNDIYDLADLFDLKKLGYFYSRLSNPTVNSLEAKVAVLEGGVAAVATSSGQAATTGAILTICQAGDHIVALNNLYGGTYNLLAATLSKLGITTTFVDFNASDAELEAAIQENTKLVFTETIGNPNVDVLDIERIANIAHKHELPLFVDNTFATPYLCNPIAFGAHVVRHSSTKYLVGHGTSLGGIIVDSGKFNWNNPKFPLLVNNEPTYHNISFTETFGPLAFIIRHIAVFRRDIGAVNSPFNAFLTNLGIETLHLRLQRHSDNALAVAKFLENHPKIESVSYPFLESSPTYANAKKYLKGGSGVISLRIKGDRTDAKKFIEALELASLVIHVADLRTYVLHPASTTHRQLSSEDLVKAGIAENQVRLSVGIENVDDIIRDLDKALEQVR